MSSAVLHLDSGSGCRAQWQNPIPGSYDLYAQVLAEGYQFDRDGLIFKDFEEGTGEVPTDGQEVLFHYTAYNESGRRIDSSYQKGVPARTRMGIQGLIPGMGFADACQENKIIGKYLAIDVL